jgi:uncharacterized membrane protein YozB (DUF420 family)
MTGLLHQPGFLGTSANFAADMTLVLMILIAGLFTVGFYLARQKRFEAHRWVQTSAVALNLILVLWLMILPYRDYIIRDSGGPRPGYFYWITSLHALLGAVAIPFGLFVTLRGNGLVPQALKFKNYKLFMRTAYSMYILTALVGVLVYLTWFVWIPNSVVY